MRCSEKHGLKEPLPGSKTNPDILDDLDVGGDRFIVYSSPKAQKHTIYLSENVESNFDYHELLNKLRSFGKDDDVVIHLANYGGDCSAGFQLVYAIQDCKAPVKMVVDAPCYSMGAILAVCGDQLEMKSGTFLMFHNYSGGNRGKGKELVDATLNSQRWIHKCFENICMPFLTKKEMMSLKNDNDVYVHEDSPEYKDRLARHFGDDEEDE